MNIKELKTNTEMAIKYILRQMIGESPKLEVSYNTMENVVNILMSAEEKRNEQETIVSQYIMGYNVDGNLLTIGAMNRHVFSDVFGVYNVNYEPIYIDEMFMGRLHEGIQYAFENVENIMAQIKAENDVDAGSGSGNGEGEGESAA